MTEDAHDATDGVSLDPGTLRFVYLGLLAFLHAQTAELFEYGGVLAVSMLLVLGAFWIGAVTEREKQERTQSSDGVQT